MELLKNSVKSKSMSTNKALDRSIFGQDMEYPLDNFNRSNQDTCLLQKPAVHEGQWVQSGDLLADCASSMGGELSLGQNLLIAYMPWEGYNYEDAILISERLVYDDLYTSVHIEKYETETRETKLGIEEITREIPEISEKEIYHLDKHGIAKIGSWVEEGYILVGKTTPINKKELSSYQKLLYTILEKEYVPVRDSSLRAPKGIRAKIVKIEVFLNKGSSKAAPYPYSTKSEYSHQRVSRSPLYPLYPLHPKGSSIKTISKERLSTQGKKKISLALFNNLIKASQKNNALGGTKALIRNGKTPLIGRWLTKEMLVKVTKGKTRKTKNVKSLSSIKDLNILSRSNVWSNGSGHCRDKIESTQNLKLTNLKTRPMVEAFGLFFKKTVPPLLTFSPSPLPYPPRRGGRRRGGDSPLGIGERGERKKGMGLKTLNMHLSQKTEVLNFKNFKSKLPTQKLLKLKVGETQLNHFLFDQRSIFLPKSFQPKGISGNKHFQSDIGLKNNAHPSRLGASPSKGLSKAIKSIHTLGETKALKMNGQLLDSKAKGLITKVSKPLKQTSKQISSKESALWTINLYLAEKRKVQVGDKLAGRHGNKGIISMILPREDMPYLPDGTPIDMVLNPLGVPSRMNVGQIYECLLGLAGKYLGENYKVFPFDEIYGPEASRSFVYSKLNEARVKTGLSWLFEPSTPGKIRLYDGRTGDCFDQAITVGIAYILRLVHMVDDKIHARSTGPYSLVTQQPLRGRSKQGGQRLGEMEVWAIEGYGAAFTLLEMLTIKSDDMTGRMTLWSNLILNKDISIGTPESFKVLVCELQALCLDIGLFRMSSSVNNTKEKALPQVNQTMYLLDQKNTVNTKDSLIELENLMNLP
jgi:DNA-directed RNA polymerase beta subunit